MIVASAAVCIAAISSHFRHPQSSASSGRNPHLHKIHVSVTNLEFDRPKQMVEIVIRVFTDDLENALSRRAKQAAPIDPATAGKDRQFIEPAMAYLRSSFELKNKTGRPVVLSWNGIEGQPDGQADMIWIFVKGRMPGGLEGAQMRNKIFCELFDDQVNIVNAKHQGKQFGLMFEAKDDFKILR
ncbi:MAG TPA: DUF6702 family protein [Blastocatellia bacterium]|nr:DUF6702 family protein [Blastocatellia bacterium]